MSLDLTKITNLEFEGVEHSDYPDYSNAYVSSADYENEPMNENDLEELNENHREFVYEKLYDYIF